MSSYIFNVVLILLFAYEAFKLFTKKNGGSERMLEKYTEESLAKYSIIAGVLLILFIIYEVIELLHRAGILYFIPMNENGTFPRVVSLSCLGGFLVIYLIVFFVVLKKRDDYTNSTDSGKFNRQSKSDEDEEY